MTPDPASNPSAPPPIRDTLETVLYAPDLDAAVAFYRGLLGLPLVDDGRPLMLVFRVTQHPGRVLLVFDPRESALPGRAVPSHGTTGPGHIALRIDPDDEPRWRERLDAHQVAIEHTVEWGPSGGFRPGRSLYLRDPAGNSVELMTADIWPSP
ncbi:MAG: VOC family protein [Phycisphaerales bacterium JB040]